jgi:hypothetical protein
MHDTSKLARAIFKWLSFRISTKLKKLWGEHLDDFAFEKNEILKKHPVFRALDTNENQLTHNF